MPEDATKEKTIGLPEAIFMTLLVAAVDLLEFATLVFSVGFAIIIVEVINAAGTSLLEMYMLLRGGRGVVKLVIQPIGGIVDGVLGAIFPMKTIAMVVGIFVINNPEKVEKIIGMITKVAVRVATVAAGAVTGGAGAVVTEALGGRVVGKVAGKVVEKTAEKAIEKGASAARSRMAMATRGARMVQSSAKSRPDEMSDIPMQEAV